jgi:hypothetical protein
MKSPRPSFTRSGPSRATLKRASEPLDVESLLHFSRQLYAHALTLQEVIRNDGEIAYKVLRPRCDQQAAQQFEIFLRDSKGRPGPSQREGKRLENSVLNSRKPR